MNVVGPTFTAVSKFPHCWTGAGTRVTSRVRENKKKRALDLFSGTQSVANAMRDLGFEVIMVDKDGSTQLHICRDVLGWDFHVFQPGTFDVIFACVPCKEYSRALATRCRDLLSADLVVDRALKIIQYLRPRLWFVENPRQGELKNRLFM